MIQENELRLGNWVNHLPQWSYRNNESKDSFYFQWSDSDWYAIGESTLSLADISPIHLTPEILEKCGFAVVTKKLTVEVRWHSFRSFNAYWVHRSANDNYWFFELWYKDDFENDCLVCSELKYLHQLQNLFFALTGEELNVQL